MKMDHDIAVSYYKLLDAGQSNWDNKDEDIARYMCPERSGFVGEKAEGEQKTQYLFDSIGMTSLDDLSNYLGSVVTPSGMDWFALRFKSKDASNSNAGKKWLQESTRLMHTEIHESNFLAEVQEFYKDYPAFGTGSMQCLEKKKYGEYDGLAFKTIHLRELSALENENTDVDMTIRGFDMTAKQIQQKFAHDPKANKSAIPLEDADNPTQKYRVIHIVWPRDKGDIDEKAFGYEDVPADKLPWGSMWINYTMSNSGGTGTLKESGYYEPPRTVVRWGRNTDSTFRGYGPGQKAMPDIKTLNEAKRLEMNAWEKTIDPPMKTTRNNILGDMNIAAGKLTEMEDINDLQPMINGTDFRLTMVKSDELKASIRETMYVDIIREPLGDSGQKTAYEIAKRMERASRLLGQGTARLRSEFLDWLVKRVFSIMWRNDRLPEFPEELVEMEVELDIRYVSPLAISQATAGLESMDAFFGRMQGAAMAMSPQDPSQWEGWDWVNTEGFVKELEDRQNIPASMIHPKDAVEAKRQAQADAAAQATAMGRAEQASNIVKNVGAGAGEDAAKQTVADIRSANAQ